MVATIGPASYNFDESLTTLRYANRAKNIKNKPKINEDPKDALLRTFQDEINRLKASLEAKSGGGKSKKSRKGRRRQVDENGDIIEDGGDDDPEGTRLELKNQKYNYRFLFFKLSIRHRGIYEARKGKTERGEEFDHE